MAIVQGVALMGQAGDVEEVELNEDKNRQSISLL